jgi:tripartite-type tricarboxylate transporter receptor subunit TctC
MAEAQKMMNSPEFQKQMKKMAGTKEYKENAKQTEAILKDPSQAAEAEARMEHMVRVGNDQMKKAAGGIMEDAMEAMNNPEVMAEMTKMMKDPNFQQQLNEMMKDPSFKDYGDAVSNIVSIVLAWLLTYQTKNCLSQMFPHNIYILYYLYLYR